MTKSPEKSENILMRSALVWNFVKFLNEEFMQRCERNSAYSLRAFARDLDMDSGSLSQFMSGKRKFTDKNIIKMAIYFGFDDFEAQKFVHDTLDFYDRDVFSFATINEDTWQFHADWRHGAVLVLMLCRDFKSDIGHIANRLKQREVDMRPILERLIRMGVIHVNSDGSWENRAEKYITTRGYPRENNPARPLNHALFEEGKRALEKLPYEEREFLTLQFEADPATIDIAREMFKKFRNELAAAMHPVDREKAEVFCLAMGLFPLSK